MFLLLVFFLGNLKFCYFSTLLQYIYSNIDKNKKNPNLRPTISQILSHIYKIAQQINAITSHYIPNALMINSSDKFLSIVKSTSPNGLMTLLDEECLLMNAPLTETIDIFIGSCYNHSRIKQPRTLKHLLRELVILCTSDAQ